MTTRLNLHDTLSRLLTEQGMANVVSTLLDLAASRRDGIVADPEMSPTEGRTWFDHLNAAYADVIEETADDGDDE